jgi:transposase
MKKFVIKKMVEKKKLSIVRLPPATPHAGWMVLLSNHVSDTKKALLIYRGKDVVEKGSCVLSTASILAGCASIGIIACRTKYLFASWR